MESSFTASRGVPAKPEESNKEEVLAEWKRMNLTLEKILDRLDRK